MKEGWAKFKPWHRHGLVLLIGGFVYILIGVSMLLIDELTFEQKQSLEVALRIVSLKGWGAQFILAGIIASVSSVWPSFESAVWGYMILTSLASAWSSIYILGFVIGDAPATNLIVALIWALLAFLWWGISGLVNPDRRAVMRNGPD